MMGTLHSRSGCAVVHNGKIGAAEGAKPQHRLASPNSVVHDKFNLYTLPVLGLMAFLGIVGVLDGMVTTAFLTLYIVLDLAWIITVPDAVPALPRIIIFHHAVTLILLAYPLRYPHFAIYSNWDGLVEINTFFLIARRQVRQMRWLMNPLFWITFFPTRFIVHPYLVLAFWRATQGYSFLEQYLVTTAQIILCCFNLLFLYRAVPASFRQKMKTYVA